MVGSALSAPGLHLSGDTSLTFQPLFNREMELLLPKKAFRKKNRGFLGLSARTASFCHLSKHRQLAARRGTTAIHHLQVERSVPLHIDAAAKTM